MDPLKAMRLRFAITVAIAVLFLCLTILFIILFATKKCKACSSAPRLEPSNAYLVFGQYNDTSNSGDAIKQMKALFQACEINAALFVSTSSKTGAVVQIQAIAVTTDSQFASVTPQQLMEKLSRGKAQQVTAHPSKFRFYQAIPGFNGLSIDGVYGTNTSTNDIAAVCEMTEPTMSQPPPTSTPTPTAHPANPDFPTACTADLLVRDFILVIDLLPNARYPQKFKMLEQFLQNLGSDLQLSQTVSRVMLVGYDAVKMVATYPFASDSETFSRNYKMLLSNASSASKGYSDGRYGRVAAPLTYIANESIGLRSNTEPFVLIIADHVPADYDTSLTSAKLSIQRLQHSGFYVSAVIPTVGPAEREFEKLIPNARWRSFGNIASYDNLPSTGLKFAIREACSYINFVNMSIPTDGTPSPSTSTTTTSPTTVTTTSTMESTTPSNAATTTALSSTTAGPRLVDCLDILVVLDRSQSIDDDDYNVHVKQFVLYLAQDLAFKSASSLKYSRIGVIQYSDTPELTIDLGNATSETSFENLVNSSVNYTHDGVSGGATNTTAALGMAYDVFSNNKYAVAGRVAGTAVVLVTDGFSDDKDAPVRMAQQLRGDLGTVIACVGLSGTNGEFSPADRDELERITNRTDLVFIYNAGNLTANLSSVILNRTGCFVPPTRPPTTAGTTAITTPAPLKKCRLFIFVVETTEIVYGEIEKGLEALKTVAQEYSSREDDTIFRLITYSSEAYSYGKLQNYFNDFISDINNLDKAKFHIGFTNLSSAIIKATSVIRSYINQPRFYHGSPVVVFLGQGERKKIEDASDVEHEAKELQKYSRYIFVGDETTSQKSNNSVWGDVVSNPKNLIKVSTLSTAESVAAAVYNATLDAWNNMVCGAPQLYRCPEAQNAVDLFLVVHQATDNETQAKLAKLAEAVSIGFDMRYDQMHLALLQYNGVNASFAFYLQANDTANFQRQIARISFSDAAGESIDSAFEEISKMYKSSGSTTPQGMRKFAETIIVYVTDTPENISNETALKVLRGIRDWRATDCFKAPEALLIQVSNSSLSNEQAVELFGNKTQLQFSTWDSVSLETQDSVERVSKAIEYICGRNPQGRCPRYCDCDTGLDLNVSCSATTTSSFLRLLRPSDYMTR